MNKLILFLIVSFVSLIGNAQTIERSFEEATDTVYQVESDEIYKEEGTDPDGPTNHLNPNSIRIGGNEEILEENKSDGGQNAEQPALKKINVNTNHSDDADNAIRRHQEKIEILNQRKEEERKAELEIENIQKEASRRKAIIEERQSKDKIEVINPKSEIIPTETVKTKVRNAVSSDDEKIEVINPRSENGSTKTVVKSKVKNVVSSGEEKIEVINPRSEDGNSVRTTSSERQTKTVRNTNGANASESDNRVNILNPRTEDGSYATTTNTETKSSSRKSKTTATGNTNTANTSSEFDREKVTILNPRSEKMDYPIERNPEVETPEEAASEEEVVVEKVVAKKAAKAKKEVVKTEVAKVESKYDPNRVDNINYSNIDRNANGKNIYTIDELTVSKSYSKTYVKEGKMPDEYMDEASFRKYEINSSALKIKDDAPSTDEPSEPVIRTKTKSKTTANESTEMEISTHNYSNDNTEKGKFYIIVGSTTNKENADYFVKQLKKRGYKKAKVVEFAELGRFRIFLEESGSLTEAKAIRNRAKNLVEDVWLLKGE
jgi:cell division septation protein DedD